MGFFERETENIRVFVVQSRKKEILHELIKKNVKIGSTVITDSWAGYSGIDKEGYTHLILNKAKKKKESKEKKEKKLKGKVESEENSESEGNSDFDNNDNSEKIRISSKNESSNEKDALENNKIEELKISNSEKASTNQIESTWSVLKSYSEIYSNSIPAEKAQEFIDEFIFRREIDRNHLDIANELAMII